MTELSNKLKAVADVLNAKKGLTADEVNALIQQAIANLITPELETLKTALNGVILSDSDDDAKNAAIVEALDIFAAAVIPAPTPAPEPEPETIVDAVVTEEATVDGGQG